METTVLKRIPTATIKKQKLHSRVENTKKAKEEMSLWDYMMKFKKKPLFTIAEEDRDLVLGSNMMTRLLQEEKL